LLIGDLHGLNTFEHQPMKVAAMEGAWETKTRAPLILFAIPDAANETNHFEIAIPGLASLILTHSLDGEVPGLLEVPPEDRPPVGIVFWSFRVMVGLGMLFILVSLAGVWQLWRGRLYDSPRLLRLLTWMIPTPFIAVLAGWFVTEVGRQPWIIQDVMRLSEAVTPSLTGWMPLVTLVGYIAVYAVIFSAGLLYLGRVIQAGLDPIEAAPDDPSARPKRPWSAVPAHAEEQPQGARS
jgi:cytochrome bd ubiquinol oxidase subunit I